jgi:poly [ADP-ribose] polymerase 6/8
VDNPVLQGYQHCYHHHVYFIIIISCKGHIRKLNANEEKATSSISGNKFVLLSSTPKKEKAFQEYKKQKGSIYCWHGSALQNWHNVLRIGLKNMSNTKYMTAGAAYGPGIYMAKEAATSMGYAGNTGNWPKSRLGNGAKCLALCEVINDVKPPNPYYVVQQENYIVTRYLFFINTAGMIDAQTMGAALKQVRGD